ncbi:UDP-4-amino-4,6-dideoxy-N-acetyl-beta-L-altrosamine transaminase [Flagellimonas sp.]|uniref:UDP-4-amino-4, 6-dideoxy-N-acetyl-beta-L-altrosamine transaminase n=1 Tax=Flagellimonas sp. TaxID=2058762 RepID=UPI003BB1ECAC
MNKNPIPYGRQDIDDSDIEAVISVLKADFLTQGPKIQEFENEFAGYIGVEYAVAVSNATAGLHLSVAALGLRKGERIITTPITFAASANCARYMGAEVWFADIDPETYLICPTKTRKLLESKPEGFFKGIIPVDFAGLPVNLEEFRKIAEDFGLWIIEDACHAPGGFFTDSSGNKQMCGNGHYADIGVFSFHPVKHIACGEGGMITTNNENLYKNLLKLRSHGITKENMSENHGGWFYEMQLLGYNYRLTDIQAALGITQLKKNPKGVIRRNEIADNYKSAFNGKVKYQTLPDNSYNAHHLFVIEVENREGLYNHLRNNGIYAQIHYIPVHTLPYYKEIGYDGADLSNSENYYKRCISLPMYPTLGTEEQEFVISKVLQFING